jgi:hypothetical protein
MTRNKTNKLRMAIAAVSATAVVGFSGAAAAFTINGGDNTKLDIYGYIKADARYDVNENLGDKSPAANISAVSTSDTVNTADLTNGHFNMTAQQTRLGLNFTQGTDSGDVKAKFEGDWASGGSAYALRIRHAYVEYKGVLVGQTWSNFTSWNDWADTLDWDGANGHSGGFRDNQVRYTTSSDAGTFSASLEFSGAANVTGAPANSAKVQLPDLTARFEGSADKIKYAVAVVARQIKMDNGADNATPVSKSKSAAGAMANMSFAIDSDTSIMAGVVGGNAMGDYIYLMPGSLAAYYDGNNIKTLSQLGASFGVSHKLDSMSELALSSGYVKTGVDKGKVSNGYFAAGTVKDQKSLFLTYMVHPVAHLMYGGEIAHYWNQAADTGKTGNATRLQFSAKYSF